MKMMKLALLGGAAFAVTAAGAQADDLSTLKAEIEALNARVAQLEASPAVPSGYSLMTYSKGDATVVPGAPTDHYILKGYSDKANVIGIMPTADAPPSTTIEWSGYVYAIVTYTDYEHYANYVTDSNYGEVNVRTRAQLKVVGKTDTAVGEVGVRVQLRSEGPGVEGDRDFFANEYWGWWAMTPGFTFGGGYTGSLGQIGYGMDGACNCWWTDWFASSSSSYRNGSFDGSYDPGDAAQIRASWQGGPFGMAIALEESDGDTTTDDGRVWYGHGDVALAGQISYSGEIFSGEISGIAYESKDLSSGSSDVSDDGWQVGAGVGFGLAEVASVSLAGAVGREPVRGDYWGVSGLISFTGIFTDVVGFEVGANWKTWEDYSGDNDLIEVLAGIYYNPVSQLTFGLEAEWADVPNDVLDSYFYSGDDLLTFDFVSIWRF